MKEIVPPLKGTRDFYPEQMAVRTWLYNTFRRVSEAFGYQEYEAPCLESISLYAAKSGEELVKEQSFVFPDRSGDLITLRPELTPSLTRMIAQRQRQLTFPLRWWSFGPFWRYERPQKGRTREFFQWNIDLIGVDNPEADAELITILATFFKTVGLTPQDVNIQVNDRQLLDNELASLDIPLETRKIASRWIDRRDKMTPAEWESYGMEMGVTAVQLAGVKQLLQDGSLWQKSPALTRLFAAIQAMGMFEYVQFNPGVIRGLDYYTGIVFEAFDLGEQIPRAIMGGGRYNNLLSDVGGESLPATGFAMGDVVITLLLESKGLIPGNLLQSKAGILVTVFDAELQTNSLEFATRLRAEGISVTCYPEPAKLPRQFKYADRMGIKRVAVIGPDEAASGTVTIKDLSTGEQQTVFQSTAVTLLKEQSK